VKFKAKSLSKIDEKLQELFAQSIAEQPVLIENLAKLLVSLELAIVGIYSTVLKLIYGDSAVVTNIIGLFSTFTLWFLALLFAILTLVPQKYSVDVDNLESIREFFSKSAKRKLILVSISIAFFFGGIVVSVFSII